MKFKTSKLWKSIAMIAGGTAFAQLLNILLSPLITRIFPPEEYGILVAYNSILAILSMGAFKYEVAIPITKQDNKATNVLLLSFFIIFTYVSLLTIFLLFLGKSILNYLNLESLNNYYLLIPLGILFSGLYKILKQWSFRIKDYKSISKTTINQSISGNIVKIVTGLIGMGPLGLILGTIIGQSAGLATLAKPLINSTKSYIKNVKLKYLVWSLKKYKDFPLYNLPTYLLITLGNQAPIIFLSSNYGVNIAGLYGLAYTIVKLPMNLIGNSVSDVFFAESAKIGDSNPEKIKKLSISLIKKLIFIGLLPLIILLLFGPYLFSFVFGSNWYQAGVYAQLISIMLFSTLIFAPVSRVYEIFEKQKIRFYIDVARIILIFLVFILSGVLNFNSYLTIFLYSVVISIIYLLVFIYAQKILNDAIKRKNDLS